MISGYEALIALHYKMSNCKNSTRGEINTRVSVVLISINLRVLGPQSSFCATNLIDWHVFARFFSQKVSNYGCFCTDLQGKLVRFV